MFHREETVNIKRCVLLSKSDSELTSMPVPSVSPFVLVLCGFELGDVSVATGITEVSPSRFDGAWLEDVAEAAPASAGPEVDAVLFRGMTVAGGSLYRILGEAARGESKWMREERRFPTRSDVSRISLRQRLLSDA